MTSGIASWNSALSAKTWASFTCEANRASSLKRPGSLSRKTHLMRRSLPSAERFSLALRSSLKAIENDVSERSADWAFHGPENPSTYVIDGHLDQIICANRSK